MNRLSAQAFHDRIEELRHERDELKHQLKIHLRYIQELEQQLENAEPGLLEEVRQSLEEDARPS